MTAYVRYMDRTRDYYKKKGYEKSYRWAHYEDVPFTPLKKPLSESRLVLVSTTEIAERLYSTSRSYDRVATTMEDVDAFFPISAVRAAVESGRIGGVTKRFHGVYNAYSQRRTLEQDAVEVIKRCREDGADVAVLTPS